MEEIQKKQDRIDLLQVKINENQAETQRLFSTAQGFRETVAEKKSLKEKVQHLRETMNSLAADMQEYTETDEELQAMKDSFGKRNADAQEVIREKTMKRKQLMDEIQRTRDELQKRTAEMGGLEEAKRANERNVARREEVVKEVATRHGYKGMDVIMDDRQIDEIKSLLLQSLKEQKGNLDKIKVPGLPIILLPVLILARFCDSRERTNRPKPRSDNSTTNPRCRSPKLQTKHPHLGTQNIRPTNSTRRPLRRRS